MTNAYNHTLSITLPANLAGIASAIGRALDPDSGGDKSFTPSEDGLTISTSTPCTEQFYSDAQLMLAHPEALHAAVAADYAARWGDLVVPTLGDCQAFCSAAVMPEPALPI